jgi:hypothetical protein
MSIVAGRFGVPCALAVTTALFFPRRADAQIASRFTLRGEASYAIAAGSYQRRVLDQVAAVNLAVRAAARLAGPLSVQIGYDTYLVPSTRGLAQQHDFTAGLRFAPRTRCGQFFVDTYIGPGLTGDRVRFVLEVGTGFEFDVTSWLRLGPVLRYARLFAAEQDQPSDAQFVSLGLSLALHLPERHLPAHAVVDVTNGEVAP